MESSASGPEQVIEGYVPVGVDADTWKGIECPVRGWVRAAQPGHRRRALQLLHAATHLAAWARAEHIPVRADTALRDSTIERFCALAENDGRFSKTTRATIRSHLRYLARAQAIPGNAPQPPELPRARVKAPYSDLEVAGYFALARAQSKEMRRSRLVALLCSGLGAGCGPADLRYLRGSDVRTCDDGAVEVELRGPRPRTVVVLDRYSEELAALAAAAGPQLLIGGVKPERRAVTGGVLSRVEGGRDLAPLESSRLRSTWLVHHLRAGTRIDVLMVAAGLRSANSLVDLLPLVGEVPSEQVRSLLRGPAEVPSGPGDCHP